MRFIPTSTSVRAADDLCEQFVIFVEGAPAELVEAAGLMACVEAMLVEAPERIVEWLPAEAVSAADMAALAGALAGEIDWPEYIGVSCQTCGDAGVICGSDGISWGDCPVCGVE